MKKINTILCITLLLLPIVSVSALKNNTIEPIAVLPAAFSWRDINGTDYTTPIRDQSPAPTCEAFAICAVLETKMQYQLKERYNPDLSENHLFFYAGGTIEKGYVSIVDAAQYLMEVGVPDEGCFPDPHRAFDYSFESLPGWENRTVKITEWGWVDHNITAMKQALTDHGPLIICIHFWQDFFYYKGGVYKHHTGEHAGGHVVTIVGYDDSKSCWIVKNSWGTKWGEKGWFKMAYDADMIAGWYGPGTGVMYIEGVYGNLKPDAPKAYIEKPDYSHSYFFGIGLPTLLKNLSIQKAAARIFGPLTVRVTAENTNSVEFFIDDASKSVDTEAPFSWKLDTTSGLHTLMVKATNDHNISSLDIQDIYVMF
ncbi:MAG TPA: C1 family peptidase [Candidatus Thermoplasmatota archaeon]|nr:C1 family peptidase [Candidatus Thermoplasmatota archaeon]